MTARAAKKIEQETVRPAPPPHSEEEVLTLAQKIDRLWHVRSRISVLAVEEKELSDSIKSHMVANGLSVLEGDKHTAKVIMRRTGEINPRSLIERVGLEQALTAMKVLITECRKFMGENAIDEIRGGEKSPTLTIE